MIPRIASQLWWHRFLARHARSWEELQQFPRLSPREQRRQLAQRLLSQIQYFGNREDALPEWREAARIQDPEELWRQWPFLPVVDKKMLQSRFQPQEIQARFGLEGIVRSSGGSTGEPTHVLHDPPMMRATAAASTYSRLRMGWRPGMATVIVWGSDRDIGKSPNWRTRAYTGLLRDITIDGFHLSDRTVDRVVEEIRNHRPVALQGYSSMLEFVARRILETNRAPASGSVRTAWNGGEMLYADQVATFRKAFDVPILNRYGGRELSVMACQFEDGGPLQVLRPWLFLELVDDRGRPVEAGESGRLLWTSTVCRGSPVLRYDIGDLGTFQATHQSESGVFALQELHGRHAGLLRLPDGRTFNCIYWNHLFKEFAEIQRFQVVIRGDRELHVLLQGQGLSFAREARLRQNLTSFLGNVPLSISWVDRIPLTARGKLLQVVREQATA